MQYNIKKTVLRRIALVFANILIIFSTNAQFSSNVPEQKSAVSFGLGTAWLEEVPGMLIEGSYKRMLGVHVLTSVTFAMNAAYSGFKNTSVNVASNTSFPDLDQKIQHLAGMHGDIGYHFFSGRHQAVMQGGPGLYYSTLVLSETVNQQLTLTHTSEVVIGFETSVGYKLKLNNDLATGIHLFGMFSRKDSQTGIAVKLEKGF